MKITILNQACLDKDVLFRVFNTQELANKFKPVEGYIFSLKDVKPSLQAMDVLEMIPLSFLIVHDESVQYLRHIFYDSMTIGDYRILWRVSLPELKKIKEKVKDSRKYLSRVLFDFQSDEKMKIENSRKVEELEEKIKLLDEFILELVNVCTDPNSNIVHYINQEF